MSSLDGKIILVIGGTGSIGEKLVLKLLKDYTPRVIRIFSRDETKQFLIAKKFDKYATKLRFFIGNIRDKDRLERAIKNVDVVFHLAAMKHVGACEYNPFEAVKTNIIGIQNLIEVCIDNDVEKVIFTSTDKAATPCNTMGVTKLVGEKLITAANYYKGNKRTIFYSVRFGNVLGSRGSLIPIIEEQVKKDLEITLTHKNMTRYIMDTRTAIEFILGTYNLAQGGEVFIHKMDVIKIIDLIEVLIEIFSEKYNKKHNKIKIKEIGMFVGEKLYEELFSIEEAERTYELDDLFVIIPQLTEVSRKIKLTQYPNIKKFDINKSFNSNKGPFLSKNEISEYLTERKFI